MDNAYLNTAEVALAQANASFAAAVGVAGLHDPCSYAYTPFPTVRELGWDLWASEDFSRDVSAWQDSQNYWMKALSQHCASSAAKRAAPRLAENRRAAATRTRSRLRPG